MKCNMCGEELDMFDEQNNFNIDTVAMYGSIHDRDTIKLRLCCRCMDKIIDWCRINPVTENNT